MGIWLDPKDFGPSVWCAAVSWEPGEIWRAGLKRSFLRSEIKKISHFLEYVNKSSQEPSPSIR